MIENTQNKINKSKLSNNAITRNPTSNNGEVNRSALRCRRLVGALAIAMCLIANTALAKDEEIIQRLGKLERALDNRGLLDLLQRLESLQAEVQSLRGQIEEQQYTIERLRKSQRDAYVDLDRRMQESLLNGPLPGVANANGEPPLTIYQPGESPDVAGTPAPGINVRVQPPLAAGAATRDSSPLGQEADRIAQSAGSQTNQVIETNPLLTGETTSPNDPRFPVQAQISADQAYRDAFGLLKAGKYDESIEAFNLFLLDYPDSEFADNAQYWLGETFFVKQDYTSAIDEYRKLISNFPASKKQSHALLKIGYSYQRLGELDNARAVLKDLQVRYPGTTAARLAAERIQQILAASP